jgi:hypothetical protein
VAGVLRSEIVTRVRLRANMESSAQAVNQFVTDAELEGMVNDSSRSLYDLMIQAGGGGLPKREHTFQTVVGQTDYDMPADIYRLVGVRTRASQAPWVVELEAFQDRELPMLLTTANSGFTFPENTRYQMKSANNSVTAYVNKIELQPAPRQVFQVVLRYIPVPIYTDPGGADYYIECGDFWDEWIVWDCVCKVYSKLDQDPSQPLAQRAQVEARVRAACVERDSATVDRVVDMQGSLRFFSSPRGLWGRGYGWPY